MKETLQDDLGEPQQNLWLFVLIPISNMGSRLNDAIWLAQSSFHYHAIKFFWPYYSWKSCTLGVKQQSLSKHILGQKQLAWNRHKNVSELNRIMKSKPSMGSRLNDAIWFSEPKALLIIYVLLLKVQFNKNRWFGFHYPIILFDDRRQRRTTMVKYTK
jgi:hypothetical protein